VARPRPDDDLERATVDLGPHARREEGVLPASDAPFDDDGGDDGDSGHDSGDIVASVDAPLDHAHSTRTVAPIDPVHALPTQQLGRRAAAARAGTDSNASAAARSSTTASPVEAMRLEEMARTRIFLKAAIITGVASVAAAQVAGGDSWAFWVVVAGAVVTSLGSLWMLWLTNDPTRYTPRTILPPAMVLVIGSFGGLYYWGVGSPVAAMYVWGIYFFSLGANSKITAFVYTSLALLHLTFGVLIVTGAVADHGIIHIQTLPTLDQITILVIIEFLYFITFFTARISQRVTLEAVNKLEQAVRGVAQREALLAEARAELDRALKIGGPGRFTEQVVGSFRLGVLIGRGGMGEVYEAHSVTDQREAAVKLLHPGTLGEPTHVARFLREAETASKLDCPNVVRVLEVGTTSGEVPFLAMERLRGHDLAHQLRRQRRLTLAQVQVFVDHVAVGLEAARAAGIVHRDLKPHNVFFAESNGARIWKILDFGVSKSGGSGTLTRGHVVGTPAYMAPEQARGEDVDHRADVYSLAAIIYRALTGHPAFSGKDVPSTLYDVVYRVPTQPSILASLGADIDRVLALGLAKDPGERIATARELATWLAAAGTDSLTQDQRRRADDVTVKHPWGTRRTAGS
jgi:serine/threonine-protein kinase